MLNWNSGPCLIEQTIRCMFVWRWAQLRQTRRRLAHAFCTTTTPSANPTHNNCISNISILCACGRSVCKCRQSARHTQYSNKCFVSVEPNKICPKSWPKSVPRCANLLECLLSTFHDFEYYYYYVLFSWRINRTSNNKQTFIRCEAIHIFVFFILL